MARAILSCRAGKSERRIKRRSLEQTVLRCDTKYRPEARELHACPNSKTGAHQQDNGLAGLPVSNPVRELQGPEKLF
jgi:hypothetical protein